MALKLVTPPADEPVDLPEVKQHLRIDSGTLADNLSEVQSILAGPYTVDVWKGKGVEVAGYDVIVVLAAGTCGGTVNVRLQESDTDVDKDYTDVVPEGTFDEVTGANDKRTHELAYSGTKKWLRAVATVTVNTCNFGVVVVRNSPISMEDDLILGFITAAREWCEGYQNRAYITQTWDLYLDDWPESPFNLPKPPLQFVAASGDDPQYPHIKYYGTDGTEYDFEDFEVDIASYKGRISLAYGKQWPSTILRPMNGVKIQFMAGYGNEANDVPERIRTAIKLLVGEMYENREATDIKEHIEVPFAIKALLGLDRIVPI